MIASFRSSYQFCSSQRASGSFEFSLMNVKQPCLQRGFTVGDGKKWAESVYQKLTASKDPLLGGVPVGRGGFITYATNQKFHISHNCVYDNHANHNKKPSHSRTN